jgi:O-antigen ligase
MIKSRIIALGFFLFSLSWVLINHYLPWLSFHSEALAFVGLVFIVGDLLNSKQRTTIPRVSNWIVFTSLLPLLQYAKGVNLFAGDALLGGFYQIGFFMSVVAGHALVSTDTNDAKARWLGLAHAIWIAALLSAAIGLIQWLKLTDQLGFYAMETTVGARAMGNLAQSNQLATLLLLGVVSLVYVYEMKRIGPVALGAATVFITVALVLAQSRAGLVSAVMVSAFVLWKHESINSRIAPLAVIAWILGLLLATLCLPAASEWLLLSDTRSLTGTESVNERWLIWKQVAYAIGQAPWLGYGWNQTPTANAVGAMAFPGSTTYTNAHNIVLDLMVWCGIPLGLLLTGAMVYWFVSRLRTCKRPDAIWAMAGLLPIAVHSLLEFPFAYAYFLIAAGFFVGIVEAAHIPAKVVWVRTRWLWVVLGVWAGIGAYMAYEYFQIEEDFRIVRFENMHVGATPAGYEAPHVWMLSQMAAMLNAARQVPKPGMPKADLENLRKVSDRFAYGSIRFKYAQALALNGDPAEASRQMRIIHGMYGDFFYRACQDELIRLSNEKFPQLKSVSAP